MIDAERMAGLAIPAASTSVVNRSGRGIATSPEQLTEYLAQHGVQVRSSKKRTDGSVVLILNGCPMNSDHGRGSDTAVIWRPDGIGFVCRHNGCSSYTWHDVRGSIDPDHANRTGCEGEGPKRSQADRLVALAESVDLFHTPGGVDSEAYASIPVNGHRETWPIRAKGFRRWLARQFYLEHEKVPGSQALSDALHVIAGRAIYDADEHDAHVRLAEHDGAIWLDLANADWQAVQITSDGWRVVASDAVPVRFIRKRGMLPLPAPESGGHVDELRSLVNLPGDQEWRLVAAWLVATIRPRGPYTILCVNGEHGSAKSTLCRVARALIDPNVAPLRRPPKDDRDLMIAASNGWIVAYDNLSSVPVALSDALCCLATGGGFGTRELYSDDQEKLFDAVRPVMINGIEDLATRADLLDRSICLVLPEIPDRRRIDEKELWERFEQARPRILGALLDAAATALRNLPNVKLESKPRMADFATWVTAAESAFGWSTGTFINVYGRHGDGANVLALESSILGSPIQGLLNVRARWDGTAKELLAELDDHHSDEKTRKRKEWPKSPRGLSAALRRIAPNLRRIGIDAHLPGPSDRPRVIRLENVAERPSHPSEPTPEAVEDRQPPDQIPTVDDGDRRRDRRSEIASGTGDDGPLDVPDGSDGCVQIFSAPQTDNPSFRSHPRPTAELAPQPPVIAELSAPPEGWTPDAWRDRLVQLADQCEGTNPARASELRRAAAILHDQGKARLENNESA